MSVDDVRDKVRRILTDEYGSVRIDRAGIVLLEHESAIGYVDVIDWGDGDTIVKIYSPLLSDVDLTPDVFRWVAVEGQGRWFAHARVLVDSDNPQKGTIAWEYDILGNALDPEELIHCVNAVMAGANTIDDELQQRFGGSKGAD